MLDRDNPVQGVGVYFEFTGGYGSLQYVVTPHGYSEDGALLMPYVVHRLVSDWKPKAHWKRTMTPVELSKESTHEETMTRSLARGESLTKLVNRLLYGEWTMAGPPLYFEVSKKDLTDLRSGKTPTSMMQRVEKIKAVAEFPKVKEED